MSKRVHTNVVVVVGGRGTGKTTLVQKIMDQSPLKKKLVVDTSRHPAYDDWPDLKHDFLDHNAWTTGRYFLYGSNPSKLLNIIDKRVRNTLVVFEDVAKLIGDNPPNELRRIILDSKQTGNDVIFIFHSLAEVPKKFYRWVDYLVLFKTIEVIEDQKGRISCYHRILPHFKSVNEHKNKYYYETIAIAAS